MFQTDPLTPTTAIFGLRWQRYRQAIAIARAKLRLGHNSRDILVNWLSSDDTAPAIDEPSAIRVDKMACHDFVLMGAVSFEFPRLVRRLARIRP
jgi:hypothetical protein